MSRAGSGRRLVGWLLVVAAVATRPTLWVVGLRQVLRLAPRGWWRRPPFLPLPDGDYLAFRMVTQYGDARAVPVADDVVAYLRWCRNER